MKRDSLRGAGEASAFAARFRGGVVAVPAEKVSTETASGGCVQQQPGVPTSVAALQQPTAGDAAARPSPVKFTVEPQPSTIKPQPERPAAATAVGKLTIDKPSSDKPTMMLQEDLVEFNKDDNEVSGDFDVF